MIRPSGNVEKELALYNPLRFLPRLAAVSCLFVLPFAGMTAEKSQLVANLESGKKQVVVAYGTSLTAGGAWVGQISADLKGRYPGLLSLINSGKGGMWSKWGVDNLDSLVIAKHPDTVLIEFSINDAFLEYKTTVEQARQNWAAMVDRILAANASCEIILMVMNPPTGVHLQRRPQIEAYNQMVRALAEQRKLRLIDHFPPWQRILQSDPALFAAYVPDGIHPNAEGCAKVILPAILSSLGVSDRAGRPTAP